jgi:uncharacterized protein YdeI (YjbR/CyaY-like superfamily)
MATSDQTYVATSCNEWREWLAQNHDQRTVVWVLFQKKHTGKGCMSYEESVEEALCYGWIDSLVKRIDDNTYARKFTPRTDTERWSHLNKRRIAKCIREGRMTPLGLAKVGYDNPGQEPVRAKAISKSTLKNVTVPSFIRKELMNHAAAWKYFTSLAPSHQRQYIMWITYAKRQETQERRLKEALKLLARKEKLGLK